MQESLPPLQELSPPLVDDFLYLCDDAYTREELLKMETEILQTLGYDINIPVAYRFLRRFARAADASLETHTLARYIAESTLQEYQFVGLKPSLIASSAMYLALRMNKLGGWVCDHVAASFPFFIFSLLPRHPPYTTTVDIQLLTCFHVLRALMLC